MHHPSPHILELIDCFLRRQATDAQVQELQVWLEENPEHVRYFKKTIENFQTRTLLKEFDQKKTHTAWNQLADKLLLDTGKVSRGRSIQFSAYALRIAASVSVLLIASFVIWKLSTDHLANETTENLLVFHSAEKSANLMLPDSSWVWLNANSSIEYAADFNQKREVRLTGEAFFDVRKKRKNNFIVITEHLSIQVKGTRFNVQAYATKNENATLEEGAIELTFKGDRQTYAMAPGDQITIDKADQKIILKKVNPSNFSAWKEDQLIFDNVLLKDIIAKIENRYQVTIVIDESIAARERLTMSIESEPIEDILEMIQLSSRLNYRIEKEHILIYE
jgi:ferric-dicitrate binding protein FerR (iron transport regulator)